MFQGLQCIADLALYVSSADESCSSWGLKFPRASNVRQEVLSPFSFLCFPEISISTIICMAYSKDHKRKCMWGLMGILIDWAGWTPRHLRAGDYCFPCISSFAHHSCIRQAWLLSLFFRWANWDTEQLIQKMRFLHKGSPGSWATHWIL